LGAAATVASKSSQDRSYSASTAWVALGLGFTSALDVFGDRWTLLIVRDLILGRSRFKDFTASPEGIPTNILSERLERLLRHGVVKQVPADDGTKRFAYQLTAKGLALRPILMAMKDWGLKWEKGTRALLEPS
jgi:DNA-binding HxlR family transcriptional regulator